ncbi:MAG: tRNA epoxyqueuosine(34) reductase QueG [Bacteroidia bacterium]
MNKQQLSEKIKQDALELGFDMAGISEAVFLEKEAKDLEIWLKQNQHGSMTYMENYFDKRTDPRLLVEGAKSVITVLHNYFPTPSDKQPENAPKISMYALGEDYHHVLKRKLYILLEKIKENSSQNINARIFVDSAPVMDKAWAKRAGLGWIGKNTNLISPQKGSYFFIGEIILDLPLDYDSPIKDFCGTCTRCIDACPTEALLPYQIDAKKCISYLTIELKENIATEFEGKMDGWAYGCDVCQIVCPWNRFSSPHQEPDFKPLTHILAYTAQDWLDLDKSTFKKITKKSAMSRVKWEKLKHNLQISHKKTDS